MTRRLDTTGPVQVYAGVRDEDGLPVLAKRYPIGSDPDAVRQFEQEYQLLRNIESDGVIHVLGLERLGDSHVLLFEAFEGMSLQEYAARERPGTDIFLSIAVQLARTLSDIHHAGVIHRDLKPANILIDPWQLRLRVTGFEISVDAAAQSTSVNLGILSGTLPYLSPEQTGRMRRRIDYRSDLYSLGITLYELATGGPPFKGTEALEIVHAHLARHPEPPHLLAPGLSPMISRIILRLLEKAPEDRYQSASALLADLQRCQELYEERGTIPEFEIGTRGGAQALQPSDRLYGRDHEMGLLDQALGAVRGGACRFLAISGAPGVGKTAVVESWLERVGEEHLRILRARFEPSSPATPYAGLKQAFTAFVDQLLTETDDRLSWWRSRLAGALGHEAAVVVELVPKLGWILGPQPPVTELPPVRARERLARAIGRLVAAMASPEVPVVLFVDDLQWADEGSLGLLEFLATGVVEHPVLIVGAYQHRDLGVHHPLTVALDRIASVSPAARLVRLQPLRPADVNSLVADSLGRSERETAALTSLIARRTDNNPLFVRQFLGYACELGLFQHQAGKGWSWDLRAIERAGLPDDVAGMMTDKIARLPLRVQRVLKHAAVVGARFDLDALVALDPEPDELGEHLRRLVEEGLLATSGEGYRFTHERIRQAVLELVPGVEAARLCRLVGRHRLRDNDPELLGERVFEVVDALNKGAALVRDDDERLQLVELNLLAGRRALGSAVSATARVYLDTALDLLVQEDLARCPRLCLEVYTTAAHAAEASGFLDRAEELYLVLLGQELDDHAAGGVIARLVALHGRRGDADKAVAVGRMGLRRLGVRLPERVSRLRLLLETLWTWAVLALRRDTDWFALDPVEDPRTEARGAIVAAMGPSAYQVDRAASALPILRELRRVVPRGFYTAPSLHLALFGVLLATVLGRHASATRYGELAVRLDARFPKIRGAIEARLVLHAALLPWSRHWRDSVGCLLDVQREATDRGDTVSAVLASSQQVTFRLVSGSALDEVEDAASRSADLAREAGMRDVAAASRVSAQVAGALRRGTDDVDLVATADLDALKALPSAAPHADAVTVVMLGLLVLGRYDEARAVAERLEDGRRGALHASFLAVEHQVLQAVATAAASQLRDPHARRLLRRARRRLVRWSRTGAVNLEPRRCLVEAELARIEGRHREAMEAYTLARTACEASGFRHVQALASERQGTLALEQGWELEGRTYLGHARRLYETWGAEAKVRALDAAHGRLLNPLSKVEVRSLVAAPSAVGTLPPVQRSAAFLDLSTLMATARALSEEVELDRLVERILVGALENAGASRGVLLLADGDRLVLEAESSVEHGAVRYRPVVPLESAADQLPVSVVRFAARSFEAVVLGDASRAGTFTIDDYIVRQGSRSILCVPFLKRTKLVGVLYLENPLVTQAFTEERQALLQMVAGQAAVALENARLVEQLRSARDELEQRVRIRTQEMLALQDDLVAAARRAGMAEVATGVLHNVGNILNSVNTSSSHLEETLRRSRLPSLDRTVKLLEDRREDLPVFLVEDERGRKVPDFLRLIVRQLASEHERMRDDVDQLHMNVEHVRQVIAAQQTFAGVSGVVELASVEDLVEEAIRICGATRPWRDHRIVRQYEEVEGIVVERHKVLQILVNLIANARDSLDDIPEGQDLRIVVGVRQAGEKVQIAVRDFGVGIAPENLDRIFNHGFTTKKTGHGFGLHSSAIAARELGGRLGVESEGVGRGATFTLDLPVQGLAENVG